MIKWFCLTAMCLAVTLANYGCAAPHRSAPAIYAPEPELSFKPKNLFGPDPDLLAAKDLAFSEMLATYSYRGRGKHGQISVPAAPPNEWCVPDQADRCWEWTRKN